MFSPSKTTYDFMSKRHLKSINIHNFENKLKNELKIPLKHTKETNNS